MSEKKIATILLVDDKHEYRSILTSLLTDRGYKVVPMATVAEAVSYLSRSDPPTFILADRKLETGNIEIAGLSELRALAGGAHVLVYTRLDELTPAQRFAIRGAGAIRVLDKKDINALVDTITVFTTQFEELLDLSSQLQDLTRERSRIPSALLGADVGVTVIDKEFHCWYANSVQERLVGGSCMNSMCWMLFHGHPSFVGRCWGCTVAEVFEKAQPVERLFLSRFANGGLHWVSVLSTPIRSETKPEVIAVREAVTEVSQATLGELNLRDRLLAIAKGLIHVGFGRARIYQVQEGRYLILMAAASFNDSPSGYKSDHLEDLALEQTPLDFYSCPYATRAQASRLGMIIQDWNEGDSPSVANITGLKPPYFDIPIRGTNGQLCAWLALDFGDLPETADQLGAYDPLGTRDQAVARYVNEATLQWLSEDYGREIRRAFEAPPANALNRYLEIVERARLRVGSAESVSDAKTALRAAAEGILPAGTRISIRSFCDDENSLVELEDLSCGPRNENVPLALSLSDLTSLAARAVNLKHALWLDDLKEYRKAAAVPAQAAGYSDISTASTAHLPLQIEQRVYGSLSIDSPVKVIWDKGGFKEPLRRLAYHLALLIRDIRETERLDRAREDVAALIAASLELSGGSLWRQWALERLQEVASVVATALTLSTAPRAKSAQAADSLREASALLSEIAKGPSEAPQCSLDSVFAKLTPNYGNDPRINFPKVKGQPLVGAPAFVVRHIIRHLLDNAIQALNSRDNEARAQGKTPPVGKIDIQVRNMERSAIISVQDNGPGVAPEVYAELFRGPIVREGRERVSLLCARGLARAYNGDLKLNDVGSGGHFMLRLPLC